MFLLFFCFSVFSPIRTWQGHQVLSIAKDLLSLPLTVLHISKIFLLFFYFSYSLISLVAVSYCCLAHLHICHFHQLTGYSGKGQNPGAGPELMKFFCDVSCLSNLFAYLRSSGLFPLYYLRLSLCFSYFSFMLLKIIV